MHTVRSVVGFLTVMAFLEVAVLAAGPGSESGPVNKVIARLNREAQSDSSDIRVMAD